MFQAAHGFGKKAYPATRYVRENLFKLCSECHSYYTWKNHQWVEWTMKRLGPELYQRVRSAALANRPVDLRATAAALLAEARAMGLRR